MGCSANSFAAVRDTRWNLQHDGGIILAQKERFSNAARGTVLAQIVQRDFERADGYVPPVDLGFVDMPGFGDAWEHFGVAKLGEAFGKERIAGANQFQEETELVGIARQVFYNCTCNPNLLLSGPGR